MPISGQTLLAMAAATGELHVYVLSESEVITIKTSEFVFFFFFSVKMGKGIFYFLIP